MSAAILVGSLVRVARPVGGGPVNREGYTGRVLDIAGDRHGREALIDYGQGPDAARWVPMRYLVPAEERTGRWVPPGFIGRAYNAEPEGHDDHLDAIERRLALGNAVHASVMGSVTVAPRVVLVPSVRQ